VGAPQFLPPAESPELPGYRTLDAGNSSGYGEISSVDRNPQTGEVTVTASNSGGTEYPWGKQSYHETIEHRTSDAHPDIASLRGSHRLEITVPGRVLLWEAGLDFMSDRENFHYRYSRRLSENGELVREKSWDRVIPRDYQ
jgi:hypothetical protein